jgi:protein tyrosine/serine phosphatase/predicted nucleotidyltransferase
MKQINLIETIKEVCFSEKSILTCLIIGSYGRKDATVKSDIDIQIVVDSSFQISLLSKKLNELFQGQIKLSFYIEEKKKLVFYIYEDYLLCEIFVCYEYQEINKYFLGSEIDNVSDAILFDKTNQVSTYLNEIRLHYKSTKIQNRILDIEKNIKEFLYRFESCSSAHSKSDGYKFYLLYNNALNCLVRLIFWANEGMDYSYLPPNFLNRFGHKMNFLTLDGSMFLPRGNELKRKLLDKFYEALNTVIEKYNLENNVSSIRNFCEHIYERDFFWNFRDVSTYNPLIKKKLLFRSTHLTQYQNEKVLYDILQKEGITTIIDLRADDERIENPYNEMILSKYKYEAIPIDPRIQSQEFKEKYNQGTNSQIAYQYYAMECKRQVKNICWTLLNNSGSTLVHCVAGRDRTGSMISLIHLLSGADIETVVSDYLASYQDTKMEDIMIFINLIQLQGGISSYLLSCGLTEKEIKELQIKICS